LNRPVYLLYGDLRGRVLGLCLKKSRLISLPVLIVGIFSHWWNSAWSVSLLNPGHFFLPRHWLRGHL
jgi:hypothetical protein